ncbi:MAG TPA: GntR family transcriptional regulator [Burkholderiales bacterium]
MSSKRSDLLAEAIEEKIATGVYAPGSKLDEVVLAEEFGVSRTPVREALIQLAPMGLIELRPRRGAIVAKVGPQRLWEMFEVMAELEAMCARLAARRMTEADLQKLNDAHAACEQARSHSDCDLYYHCNETLHQAIYAASHNSFLEEQAIALQRRLRPYRRLQLRVRNRMSNSFAEHAAIIEAITSGDGERAAQQLRDHVVVQGERFADLVASLSALEVAAAPG